MTRQVHHGIRVTLLAAISCAAVQAVGSAQAIPRPEPIEAALNLLRWPTDQTPTIVVVAERPERVSSLAEGWVFWNNDGSDPTTIYVAGWSKLYRDALANPRVSHNIIRLAGVLTHERAHIRHGPNEEVAYAAQLIALEQLHAQTHEITNVHRAFESVRRQHPGRSQP